MQTQTHDLTFTPTQVRKRYVSWDRGEPEREWTCLTLLARYAPGVAPRPVRRGTEGGIPVVVMERLPERVRGPATVTAEVATWLASPKELSSCREPRIVQAAVEAVEEWFADAEAVAEPRPGTLGIADLNPANVLWDGPTCRLVDFEDGGVTDPAYELADHVEHLAGRLARFFDPRALVEAVDLTEAETPPSDGTRRGPRNRRCDTSST